MAPIHESDLAEKRWHEAEWKNFELWEKIELRIRRARLFWIIGTSVVFLFLASIPTLMDRGPKWKALKATRWMAQYSNQTKRLAIESGKAMRLRFLDEAGLSFRMEEAQNCEAPPESWVLVREGRLLESIKDAERLRVLSPEAGVRLGVPGLTSSFCYDPLLGAEAQSKPGAMLGLGVIPAADFEQDRADRIAVLLVSESVGDLSFE